MIKDKVPKDDKKHSTSESTGEDRAREERKEDVWHRALSKLKYDNKGRRFVIRG